MKTHNLKIWQEPFAAVLDGSKRAEIRKNDRDFKVGDLMILEECIAGRHFTGHRVRKQITHIQSWLGLQDGYVCLSFGDVGGV
ncbi:MAG: DUF3850 domain-containing protein [Pseudomonadota bacterium]